MIRAVVDTNVLVSAALNGAGNEASLLYLVTAGQIALYTTPAVMDEYEEVLTRRKFAFVAERTAALLGFIRASANMIQPYPNPVSSPDPADTMFIACAMAAPVDFLVTGNRRDFPEPSYGTAEVVNARQLLDRLATQF